MKRKLLSLLVLLLTAVTGAWAGTQATGYFESCTAYHGSIRVKGWAYDPDQPATSIQVHAYIWYGSSVGTNKDERMPAVGINANIERSDVNEAKGITGAHGFDQYIAVPAGTYTVQVFAIDKTGDGNPKIPGTSGNPATYTVTVTDPYNITYDANGGSGAPDAQQKSEKININLSAAKPTRDGYVFKEWNTAQDGSGISYAPGAAYTADGDATLYAQWLKIDASGNCGTTGHESDVTWTLTSDGVMTISGTGAMEDYSGNTGQPWKASRSSITSVVVQTGVTHIGNNSLSSFTNMTSVSLPEGLLTIGNSAFSGDNNTSFTEVTIPASVTSIGQRAFYQCSELTSVTFSAGSNLTSIGIGAFANCSNLTTVTLNSNPAIVGTAFPSGATVTMNLTAHEGETGEFWMTFYNKNQNFQVPATGTQIFKAALSGTALTLTELTAEDKTVTKDNAVILKSTTGSTISLTLTTTASSNDFSSNDLLGVSAAAGLVGDGTIYVLGDGNGGVGFYKLSTTGNLGVGKAYLTYSGGGSRNFFGFEESETTSIDGRWKMEDGRSDVYYDLNGRRVMNPTKGLYIVNGKKVVVK